MSRAKDIFNAVRRDHPELLRDAKRVGSGAFGLVAANAQTVTKIALYHDAPDMQRRAEQMFENEVRMLRLLDGATLGHVATPALVGAPRRLQSEDAFAAYQMTRLAGEPARWEPDYDFASPDLDRHYRDAGALLARFHAVAATLGAGTSEQNPGWTGHGWAAAIEPPPGSSSRLAAALANVDGYLRDHKQAGVAHGDYAGRNLLRDDAGGITGLLDFAKTDSCDNVFLDFAQVPDEAMAIFVAGYETESGKTVDPMTITMTKIADCTSDMSAYEQGSPEWSLAAGNLDRHLTAARPVTGYAP